MKYLIPFVVLAMFFCSCSAEESRKGENLEAEVKPESMDSLTARSGEENFAHDNHQAVQEAEEEDCIFNNDLKGLTTEVIMEFDSSLNFSWNEEQQMAILPLGPDTLKLSVGGCDHFAYTAIYAASGHSPHDSLFWFGKLNWIARSFWGKTGLNFSHRLEGSSLIKTESNGNIYYEIPPDTAMTNLYFSEIELRIVKNSAKMTIGAYYN